MFNGNPRKGNQIPGKIPLHPFLFACYFVLALLGHNIAQAHPNEAIQSLIILFASTGGMVILMRVLLKDWLSGALVTSLLLILFFTYGHVYHYLEGILPGLGRHRILIPIWLLLAVIGIWTIARRMKHPVVLTAALNLVGFIALVFPIYQIISWEIKLEQVMENPVRVKSDATTLRLTPEVPPRDVYIFILDMYARQDILEEIYNFNNAIFIDELEKMGFEIAECSQANYSQTEMALTSILNMNYLQALGQFNPDTVDPLALRGLIKQNLVMQAFRELGYKLVSFKTGFHFSEFYDSDYYLSPESPGTIQFGGMNNFELMLLKSTAALVLYDTASVFPSFLESSTTDPLESKRE